MNAERQEIARRVEGLFALADQIEARFTQARGVGDLTDRPQVMSPIEMSRSQVPLLDEFNRNFAQKT
jgi:hypothetical protein